MAVGADWRVDVSALHVVFLAGGEVGFVGADKQPLSRVLDPALVESFDGELRCELVGVQALEGRDLAVIEFHGEAKGRCSRDEPVSIVVAMVGVVDGVGSRCSAVTAAVDGSLLWDLFANQAIECSARVQLESEEERVLEREPLVLKVGSTERWTGALAFAASFAPAKARESESERSSLR